MQIFVDFLCPIFFGPNYPDTTMLYTTGIIHMICLLAKKRLYILLWRRHFSSRIRQSLHCICPQKRRCLCHSSSVLGTFSGKHSLKENYENLKNLESLICLMKKFLKLTLLDKGLQVFRKAWFFRCWNLIIFTISNIFRW